MIETVYPYFHLYDRSISYILKILEDGSIGHVYFGKALENLTAEELDYMTGRKTKSAGTVKTEKGSSFSLADQMLEYPVYGTSCFQAPALQMTHDQSPLYPNLKYQSFEIRKGKHRMMEGPQTRSDPEAETLILKTEDSLLGIKVYLFYTIYPESATVVRSARIENRSPEPVRLENAASGVLNLKDGNWKWITLPGSWARERRIDCRTLSSGSSITESLYGSSSHQNNPFSALIAEDPSDLRAYGCNLVYSSNFMSRVDINEFGMLRLCEGIHPLTFTWTLDQNASFQTPEMLLMFSDQGLDGLSRVSSRFLRSHLINPRFVYRSRPVCLNSWEAVYFSLNENNLLDLAKEAAQCGIDCFVVDDGWFGHRDAADSSLGDWYCDKRKFPHGLGAFARKIRSLGMQFGLWFEPEMISEDSELFRMHPDWVIRPPEGRISYGRSQLVLDFCRPETVEAIFQMMKEIIEETGLTYIKWDMNRDITEAWSSWLDEQGLHQGELFHRYIHGVYSLYEKLESSFPDVLIEGCAAGGGRFDPGILYYSPQIWVSDNTDAFDRLKIQYATSLAYPLSCMSNHVSDIPNHQTGRTISREFRRDVAFFGIFGYELDLLKDHGLRDDIIHTQIEQYRKMEPAVLYGDFYHLVSPFESNCPAQALAWNDLVFVGLFQIQSDLAGRILPAQTLPFLQNGCWKTENKVFSARVLRNFGLRKPVINNGANQDQAEWISDYQSAVIRLDKLKPE